jgi:hypothetical protein
MHRPFVPEPFGERNAIPGATGREDATFMLRKSANGLEQCLRRKIIGISATS